MDLASSWLTSMLIEEFGFTLHKGAFLDALALQYHWEPLHTASTCDCGTKISVEHALSCSKGGFPSIKHNKIKDLTAALLTKVCNEVCVEPELERITGESLRGATSNVQDGACLNISANGFLGGSI